MYVIIIGCGRVGTNLAGHLSKDGHDVVVIDKSADSFKSLGSGFNGLTLVGNGFDEAILEEAGIDRCDFFAAVTDFDNANIMACQVAKNLYNVKRVIARVYYPDREHTYHRLGIETVCGTALIAQVVRHEIDGRYFLPHFVMGTEQAEIIETNVSGEMVGCMIKEVEIDSELRISAVKRGSDVIIPGGSFRLAEGDIILFTVLAGSVKKINDLYKLNIDITHGR